MFLESEQGKKIWQIIVDSVMSMPNYLRWGVIIAFLVGLFYIYIARPKIMHSEDEEKTELLYKKVDELNQKIAKIEEIRMVNEDMLYNIEEVRGVVQCNSSLHRKHIYIIAKYLKSVLKTEDYNLMMDEISKEEYEYRKELNELFNKKTKEHLSTSLKISEDDKK